MTAIQIHFDGNWITLKTLPISKDDAEWLVARWKAENDCHKDPFRCVPVDMADGDPPHPWKCRECGFVYGEEGIDLAAERSMKIRTPPMPSIPFPSI